MARTWQRVGACSRELQTSPCGFPEVPEVRHRPLQPTRPPSTAAPLNLPSGGCVTPCSGNRGLLHGGSHWWGPWCGCHPPPTGTHTDDPGTKAVPRSHHPHSAPRSALPATDKPSPCPSTWSHTTAPQPFWLGRAQHAGVAQHPRALGAEPQHSSSNLLCWGSTEPSLNTALPMQSSLHPVSPGLCPISYHHPLLTSYPLPHSCFSPPPG